MATLSEYYLDELYKWKSTIDSYLEEINHLEEKLKTLLHAGNILLLAGSAEQHLKLLALSRQNLVHLRYAIESFERKLTKGQAAIHPSATDHLRRLHKQLRKDIENVSMDFTESKKICNDFISYSRSYIIGIKN